MHETDRTPLLIRSVVPLGFGAGVPRSPTDILVGSEGLIVKTGAGIRPDKGCAIVEGRGAFLSPGWVDLHAHVWWGGTDIGLLPAECGAKRGVTTIVDAGSAGEANFKGFRKFVMEPAKERVLAFLNIGSIGLVACNRVSELVDFRFIDIGRTIACVEANRDLIVGIKIRASQMILGSLGITPVKVAKKVARILKLPLMVHVGEPPPLYDEVLEVLGPGDVVTHCFNGKPGGSLLEDEDLFSLAERCAERGIRLDVGHGGASYSFVVAEAAIRRGLMPFSISTDLHARSLHGPVWDMATTLSKLLDAGMPLDAIIEAVTTAPASVVGMPIQDLLGAGKRAEFTIFELVESSLKVQDATGKAMHLTRLFEPRYAIMGREAVKAERHIPAV